MGPSCRLSIETPTPLVLGVGVKFAPWTLHVTFVLIGQWRSGNSFFKKRAYKDLKKTSRPSGSVPPAPLASPRAETSLGVSRPGTSSFSSSCPSGGQGKQ